MERYLRRIMILKIIDSMPFGLAYSNDEIMIANYMTIVFMCSIGYIKCPEIYG